MDETKIRPISSRRKVTKSLYWRISYAFLLLITSASILLGLVVHYSSLSLIELVHQRLSWGIAQEVCREIRPLLRSTDTKEELRKKFYLFSQINPTIEIFLLDGEGKVLMGPRSDFFDYRFRKVPTELLEKFLTIKGYPSSVILGPMPYPPYLDAPFSVARTSVFGKPGYLYVMLYSRNYHTARESMSDPAVLRISTLLFVVTLFLISIFGLLLFFLLTKRFSQMTGIIQAFKAGDYTRRIELKGEDEISLHAQAFNEMADTIVQQISLLEKNDALRRELVSNVSHDLRRPLASMQSLLELLGSEREDLTEERKRELVDRAVSNCKGLNKLISDLFELSKLDAKDRDLHSEEFALDELIECTVANFETAAENAHVGISFDAPENIPYVLGDPGLVERALSNLIENAVRYTPAGGNVCISLAPADTRVRVEVRDNGPGISESEVPYIFDRFYRAKAARTEEHQGSGLGLPIAKRIVEAHGETLRVTSTEGQGTIFWFHLPVSKPRANS